MSRSCLSLVNIQMSANRQKKRNCACLLKKTASYHMYTHIHTQTTHAHTHRPHTDCDEQPKPKHFAVCCTSMSTTFCVVVGFIFILHLWVFPFTKSCTQTHWPLVVTPPPAVLAAAAETCHCIPKCQCTSMETCPASSII